MIRVLIYAMVYLGSALMVYNIYGFIRFARFIRGTKTWDSDTWLLNVPIILLIFFLIGYIVIGVFGKPDLMMAGVLFGGSIFVQIMYRLLNRIVRKVIESEQLKSELLAAEESSRAKASFLASLSHEMRTPIHVILGMDELALKNRDNPEQTREHLEKIGHSARHLSGLIDNLLILQQIETGGEGAHSEFISLKEALNQISIVCSGSCQRKGLDYQSSISWDAVNSYTGDASRLKQALMNILDNAVKFTDAPGSVELAVEGIASGDTFTLLRFTVSDTGVGISEEYLPRIFEPFTQEEATAMNRFGGSGVGLTAARSIITDLGGKIEVQSRKNEGTVFSVTIPMVSWLPGNSTKDGPAKVEPAPEEILEGCHVLVVDDIADNAEIVSDLLEIVGVRSDQAQNGQIAVEMMNRSAEHEYDAILMDLRMPVMDGLEATRRIRALDREDVKTIPIIALSANAYDSDVQNSLSAGMDAHLAKPADSDQLYAMLATWIREKTDEEGGQGHD